MKKPKSYVYEFFKRVSRISVLFLALLNTSTTAQADTPLSFGCGVLGGLLSTGLHFNIDYHYNENCAISFNGYFKKQELELDEMDFKSKFNIDLKANPLHAFFEFITRMFDFDNSKDKEKWNLIPKLSVQIYPSTYYSIYFAGFVERHNINADQEFISGTWGVIDSLHVKSLDQGFRSGLAIGYNSVKHKKSGFGISFEFGSILDIYELDVKVQQASKSEVTKKVKSKFSPYISLQAQYKL